MRETKCENVNLISCENDKMSKWQNLWMSKCEITKIWKSENGKCENLKKWNRKKINAKICSSENNKNVEMWSYKIVKFWKCENVIGILWKHKFVNCEYFAPYVHSVRLF